MRLQPWYAFVSFLLISSCSGLGHSLHFIKCVCIDDGDRVAFIRRELDILADMVCPQPKRLPHDFFSFDARFFRYVATAPIEAIP